MDDKQFINVDTWARKDHFNHYRTVVPCTYSLTVELDVTSFTAALKRRNRRTYAAQIWAITTAINRHEEFRMGLDSVGNPYVRELLHPAFTVFNPEHETFASIWTPYDPKFAAFHERATTTMAEHRTSTSLFPQPDIPENIFDISSLPWTPFTAFDLHLQNEHDHYQPIFTLGKYTQRDHRTVLPLAVQIHHAAADGFHTARLVNEIQHLFNTPDEWLE